MLRTLKRLTVASFCLLLVACGTTDSTMKEQGRSDTYVVGFHDGRHSGMKEAGSDWDHFIRDHERFKTDDEYRQGWLAGEAEGKRMQAQAQAAGEAVGGAYSGYQINKEIDKAKPDPQKTANDVMKDVDTTGLEALGK